MSSLGEVGDALRLVLDKIDDSMAAHQQAAELAQDARDLLASAGTGTSDGDVEHACMLFAAVVDGIVEPEGQLSVLAHAAELIRSFLTRQGIGSAPAADPATAQAPSPSAAPPATPTAPTPGSAEHVEALRAQLPPPVAPSTGQRTHGRWFVPGQLEASAIVSGQAPESAQAWEVLKATDFPEAGAPTTVTHVETKIAATMRREGIQHATVVLNNRPCRDRYGCDTVVPVLLPEGSTLTVHAPNFRKTYTGGMRAPWQR